MGLRSTITESLRSGRRNRERIATHAREIFELLQPEDRPVAPEDLGTAETNIAFNRARWGSKRVWKERDQYGYQWAGGVQQKNSGATRLAEEWLRPHVEGRFDLKIMEVAPGAGRFTVELIRLSHEIHLVDLNQACIDLCKERFKYYPDVHYHVNDGLTCRVVPVSDFDLIVCYDAMVHMSPDVIESYVGDFATKLVPGGICWLDHSGKGFREVGHRTAMTDAMMRTFADKHGLRVLAQHFRNDHDCISVLQKPK